MPIYDYRCTSCDHEVEVIHAIDGSGPEACAVCGGTMRKALSAPAVHFKGSGWAKKDAQAASKAKKSTPSTAKDAPDGADGTAAEPKAKPEAGSGAKGEPAPTKSPQSTTARTPSTPAAPAKT